MMMGCLLACSCGINGGSFLPGKISRKHMSRIASQILPCREPCQHCHSAKCPTLVNCERATLITQWGAELCQPLLSLNFKGDGQGGRLTRWRYLLTSLMTKFNPPGPTWFERREPTPAVLPRPPVSCCGTYIHSHIHIQVNRKINLI